MLLYLVRHGLAEDLAPSDSRADAERALTPEGRRKTKRVAEGLRAIEVHPARIGASPLSRARETAEIIAGVLRPEAGVEECGFLAEGPETARVVKWLKERGDESVCLVGHMPHIAGTASELLAKGGRVKMVFRKSAVCCISFDGEPAPGAGTLEWLLQPRHLRALAR